MRQQIKRDTWTWRQRELTITIRVPMAQNVLTAVVATAKTRIAESMEITRFAIGE